MVNVLYVLVDDVGKEVYSTWGMGGAGTYGYPSTPCANALCEGGTVQGLSYPGGVRFDRHYVEQLCSPTRAASLVGRHPFRTGIGDIIRQPAGEDEDPTSQAPLPNSEYTMAHLLKDHGYVTAAFGKWHLGNSLNGGRKSPQRAGFDHYVGNLFNLQNATRFTISGVEFREGFFSWNGWSQDENRKVRTYHTTYVVDEALRWARDHRDEDWFIYLPFYACHDAYTNNATQTPVKKNSPPTDLYDTGTWTTAADVTQTTTQQTMHAYRACIEATDKELGRLLAGLAAMDPDFWDNTLVIFTSDNGSASGTGGTLQNEEHPTLGLYPAGHGKDTPYEPGIWSPLVIAGYGVENPNRSYSKLTSCVDLFPTIADVLGFDIPEYLEDNPLTIDGVSLASVLDDSASSSAVRDHVYSEWFQPNGAREGLGDAGKTAYEWAIIGGDVAAGGTEGAGRYKILRNGASAELEFYDLLPSGSYDPMEATNLTPGGDTSGLNASELLAFNALYQKRTSLVTT